jgi:hypothetical protein
MGERYRTYINVACTVVSYAMYTPVIGRNVALNPRTFLPRNAPDAVRAPGKRPFRAGTYYCRARRYVKGDAISGSPVFHWRTGHSRHSRNPRWSWRPCENRSVWQPQNAFWNRMISVTRAPLAITLHSLLVVFRTLEMQFFRLDCSISSLHVNEAYDHLRSQSST